jgi:hypothetical protein
LKKEGGHFAFQNTPFADENFHSIRLTPNTLRVGFYEASNSFVLVEGVHNVIWNGWVQGCVCCKASVD